MSDPLDLTFDPDNVVVSNDPQANPTILIDPFELTEDEKKKVVQALNSGMVKLKEIVEFACGKGFDGRSKKGMAVRDFVAEKNQKITPAQEYVKKPEIVLSEAQKKSIDTMAPTAKPLEITRAIFNNTYLSNFSSEFKAVNAYYHTLESSKRFVHDEPLKEYKPPKVEDQAFARINKYVLNGIDINQITPRQRELAQKLIKFMHTHRFLEEIGLMMNEKEARTFESVFVRFTWDKPDLTEEEIDLYISYCSGVISHQRMQKELNDMCQLRDEMAQEDNRFPQALLEAIGTLRGDINASEKRQKDLLQDLNGKRKDRLDKIDGENGSILKLVENFRDAQKRERFLKYLEARKTKLKDEAERLDNLDDLHMELFGASQQELI